MGMSMSSEKELVHTECIVEIRTIHTKNPLADTCKWVFLVKMYSVYSMYSYFYKY